MYKRISELEADHRNFRRKIAHIELGPHVNVLTRTIPVDKSLHFYTKKPIKQRENETLDDVFREQPQLPLLAMDEYQPVSSPSLSTAMQNDQPLDFRIDTRSLVEYSDSDE